MSYEPDFAVMESDKAIIGVTCFSCKKAIVLEVKPEEYLAWRRGEFVQRAFPNMPAADRELLISGTCDACFKDMFGPEEDEDAESDATKDPNAQQ